MEHAPLHTMALSHTLAQHEPSTRKLPLLLGHLVAICNPRMITTAIHLLHSLVKQPLRIINLQAL